MGLAFSQRKEIKSFKDLYGRDQLFQQLISLANNRYSVSITGLRRFGKTSLLRSLENFLRDEANSNVYPVFFDFKEVGSIIKGTENVYRYMISVFVVRLFQDNHFTKEAIFKNNTIDRIRRLNIPFFLQINWRSCDHRFN